MPTKTSRPRKTAAAPPADEQPLVDLTEDALDPDSVKKLFLFELGGVQYFIPAEQPAGMVHDYIDIERESGPDAAMWWLFGALLGDDGAAALRSYKGLRKHHLRKMQLACVDTLRGPKD
ncbi:MAG: hypothetical protein YHS30scaffold324_66 [Catenulispora phage 69_17]|jgi:hypothetical protein|nr:MAG: hypothetical protein YHS30scaffold324_66 [Catenulispora phage 69_17]